jgi:hypothetical protein
MAGQTQVMTYLLHKIVSAKVLPERSKGGYGVGVVFEHIGRLVGSAAARVREHTTAAAPPARPELQGSFVQRAMADYLNALCGRPLD